MTHPFRLLMLAAVCGLGLTALAAGAQDDPPEHPAEEAAPTAPDQAPPAPPPESPEGIEASDHPLDGGHQVDVVWQLSPDDPTPKIKQILKGAGAFEVSQLSNADQVEVRAHLETFAGYKIYRSLTTTEAEAQTKDEAKKAAVTAKSEITKEFFEGLKLQDYQRLSAEERQELVDDVEVEEGVEMTEEELEERALEQMKVRDFRELSDDELEQLQQLRNEAAEAASKEVTDAAAARGNDIVWKFISIAPPGEHKFVVDQLEPADAYLFAVEAVGPGGVSSPKVATASPVSPRLQWFDGGRLWLLIITIVLCGSVIFWIGYARQGHPVRVRKIAGLEAVDEAVGRATEMGRSCLFVAGIQDMNDIQTIAGITVLARVARTAAEYDAKVEVPTSRSLVMTTARETVQAAYLAAGRPDAYNRDLIYYVTDEQFGYVAYLSGMMVRTKPAACFYMGSFFAESLILAETGNSIGAIQVAGTAQPAQLPFFVAACDYTLIGEEFFAASAYLSGSAEELGSLKGQDVGKVIVAIFMLVGIAVMTFAMMSGSEALYNFAEFIRGTMLT